MQLLTIQAFVLAILALHVGESIADCIGTHKPVAV